MHYIAAMTFVAIASPSELLMHEPIQPPAASANAWYFYWFTNPPAVLAGQSRKA